jgi:hypothetical protein
MKDLSYVYLRLFCIELKRLHRQTMVRPGLTMTCIFADLFKQKFTTVGCCEYIINFLASRGIKWRLNSGNHLICDPGPLIVICKTVFMFFTTPRHPPAVIVTAYKIDVPSMYGQAKFMKPRGDGRILGI